MKKIFFFFQLIVCSLPAFAQKPIATGSAFDKIFDTLLIHAKEKGFRQVSMTLVPYDRANGYSPVSGPDTSWTERQANRNFPGIRSRVKCTWTFLNDSLVKQEMNGAVFYGLIRDDHIYNYDRKKKTLILPPYQTSRDSGDFRITEVNIPAGAEHPKALFFRLIEDTAGRRQECFRYTSGNLCGYDRFKWFGDSAYLMKSYGTAKDSVFTMVYTNGEQLVPGMRYLDRRNVSEACFVKGDSMYLVLETYWRGRMSAGHRIARDSTDRLSYLHPGEPPVASREFSDYTYVYDAAGNLISAEEIEHEGIRTPTGKKEL